MVVIVTSQSKLVYLNTIMGKKDRERKLTMSCGALVWRIVDNKLQFLLIKQFANKDSWGVPKGHIDEGETIEQCAIREVREETGIDIMLGARLQNVVVPLKKEIKTVVTFLAQQVCDKSPKVDDPDCEVVDVKWFDVAKLPTIHFYQRELIDSALDMLTKHMRHV